MSGTEGNLSKNPFALLFQTNTQIQEIQKARNETQMISESIENSNLKNQLDLNYILEKVFLFTIDKDFNSDLNHSNSCIYIGDYISDSESYLNLDNMDELLLIRLQMDKIDNDLVRTTKSKLENKNDLFERREMFYIYNSIKRLNKFKSEIMKLDNSDYFNKLFELCVNMTKTMIELNSENKKFNLQLIDLTCEYFDKSADDSNILFQYLNALFKKYEDENDTQFLINFFENINEKFTIKEFDFYSTNLFYYIDLIISLTNSKFMKLIFLTSSFPKQRNSAKSWQNSTLLGKFLTPHFLPIDATTPYLFFQNPTGLTQHDVEINQNNMWQRQQQINVKQIQLFKHLLLKESNEIRNKLLEWIGECLYVNRNKAQEWSKFIVNNNLYASDGFFLNLLVILLDLAKPFSESYSQNLLKIDLSYSLISSTNLNFEKIHFKGFDKETKFCSSDPIESEQQISTKLEYNFITECFYAAHKCFQLSFISLYQKLMKLNQELARTQSTYEELRQQFQNDTFEPVRQVKAIYEKQTTEFLNIRISLTQLSLVENSTNFFLATCTWIAYLSTCKSLNEPIRPILTNNLDILKQKSKLNRYLLSMIPEFFLTNISEFIIFLSRFQDYSIDLIVNNSSSSLQNNESDYEVNPIILVISILMGDSEFLFNPHCRAQLAECLETLLPSKASVKKQIFSNMKEKRELLFKNKFCYNYLTEALLNVFVSIEMTGQAVQFEQKFNYRRPMYEILEYIWSIDSHKKKIKDLAKYAYEHIQDDNQPLFLRFINLLINDANYLLLEGLLYLEKIKQKQEELRNFSLQNPNSSILNNQDRNQLESSLKHLIMLAKFHNIMSTKTIHSFRLLTSEMNYFFCESALVDRVATMLNDFLLHLVGAKKNNLRVNNLKEVEFNPHDIVSTISDIYLNLGSNDDFCKAVCRDGRSYSKDLFPLAIEVLNRINRPPNMIEKFKALGDKIEEISRKQQIEDSNYDDAPDEFLDPIMSHLMVDPVILPNSKKVVDRSTISRHLLSDQTDPFNRMPLSLNEVVPDVDLKLRIEEWKASKRAKSSS